MKSQDGYIHQPHGCQGPLGMGPKSSKLHYINECINSHGAVTTEEAGNQSYMATAKGQWDQHLLVWSTQEMEEFLRRAYAEGTAGPQGKGSLRQHTPASLG